jgi:hypothetical protein
LTQSPHRQTTLYVHRQLDEAELVVLPSEDLVPGILPIDDVIEVPAFSVAPQPHRMTPERMYPMPSWMG